MNFLTRFSLKNTAAVFILCILVVFGGIYSAISLKEETMPDISIPIVAVITAYPGAAPDDVLDKVTEPIEKALSGVNGIKNVNSTSSENISSVIAEFDFSADMEEAKRTIDEAVKAVKLPEGTMQPKVMRIDFNSSPVLKLSISNEKASDEELQKIVAEDIVPGLSGLEGVGQVQLSSQEDKSVYVKFIPSKLKEYNLTSSQVVQMLQANNISFPGGTVTLGETVEPVRIMGKVSSLDELKSLQIPIFPNAQDAMKSTFTQMGQGMEALGSVVGQMGQGMEQLGSAVGQIGQGMAGMSQALNGQIQILSAMQEVQSALFADKMAVVEAQNVLKNPAADEGQKQKANAAIQQLDFKIQMQEVALASMKTKLKEIQDQMAKSTGGSGLQNAQDTKKTAKAMPKSKSTGAAPNLEIKQVALGELADITIGAEEAQVISRTNGNPSIGMDIIKSQDANTVDVADGVLAKLESLKDKLPEGTHIETILDESKVVKASTHGMFKEGFLGALFAVIVILIFLRNFRATIISAISIPLSILIALIFLKQANITLNIMTLGGITVAIGRVVDDSIVVIENIFRHLKHNKVRDVELIKLATKEVSSAITSSTLTTIAVFLPMGFITGLTGKIFMPFALTVVLCLLASLVVAVTIIPLMAKMTLLNVKKLKLEDEKESGLMKAYVRLLNWSLNHKAAVLSIALAMLVGTVALVPVIGTSFMPEMNENYFKVQIDYPAGTSMQVVNQKTAELEKVIAADNDVDMYQTTIGSDAQSRAYRGSSMGKSGAQIFVRLDETADLQTAINRMEGKIVPLAKEKAEVRIQRASLSGAGDSNKIDITVTGNSPETIQKGAEILQKELTGVSGITDISSNLSESKPEIAISVNQKKASELGLSAAQAGAVIRELLNTNTISTLNVDNEILDVRVGLKLDDVNKLEDIQSIELTSPLGKTVKLSDIAEVKEAPGPVAVYTRNGDEYAMVSARITERDTGTVTKLVEEKLQSVKLPDDVETRIGGTIEVMRDTFKQLGLAMVIAVLAVYLVMVIALGEATAPFAILFSLPLAAIGGILGLFISRQPVDMPAMIGGLMLIGIVVTNAIVLVDRIQHSRIEGVPMREAIVEACQVRMRPILMTAIATVCALIPMVMGTSKGSMMSQSLAIIVIGGLTTSTLLTLLVVPTAYEMLEGFKNRFKKGDASSTATSNK